MSLQFFDIHACSSTPPRPARFTFSRSCWQRCSGQSIKFHAAVIKACDISVKLNESMCASVPARSGQAAAPSSQLRAKAGIHAALVGSSTAFMWNAKMIRSLVIESLVAEHTKPSWINSLAPVAPASLANFNSQAGARDTGRGREEQRERERERGEGKQNSCAMPAASATCEIYFRAASFSDALWQPLLRSRFHTQSNPFSIPHSPYPLPGKLRERVLASRRLRLQIDWKHFVRCQTKIYFIYLPPTMANPFLPSHMARLFLACDWVNKHPWVSNKGHKIRSLKRIFSIYFCFGSRIAGRNQIKKKRGNVDKQFRNCITSGGSHKLTENCAFSLAANGVEPKRKFHGKGQGGGKLSQRNSSAKLYVWPRGRGCLLSRLEGEGNKLRLR